MAKAFKYLFIIESPGKVKKIKSFLNSDFEVVATVGHVSDLPKKSLGINIKKDFEPTYEVYSEKKDVVKNIKNLAKKADIIYLATDLDREGEAISQRIKDILPQDIECKRVRYNAITKKDILEGIENAGEINVNLVNSAEARRILDRLVGFKCSFITKQATGGTSAGRVQSATLRILAEREKEIRAFIPQEYWAIEAVLENKKGERVTAQIKVPDKLDIKTEKQAKEICEQLKNKNISVSKYETKEISSNAYAPFTTSSLYQAASSIMGWGSKKTASIAQALYSDGKISYIRSDSTYIVPEFINGMRDEILDKYGNEYLPSTQNHYSNKTNAQEAHEAIRMTDINVTMPCNDDNGKLYVMIWKRSLSSQMANMKQLRAYAEFQCKDVILSANGGRILFDGWRKVWNYGKVDETEIPELELNEIMKLIDLKYEQKFTEPPSRYTEASIIKQLEKLAIGRPSTYATIIDVLQNRKYVEKEKKALKATDMGISVSDFLIKSDFCFINLDFTANLEEKLDCVAKGDCQKVETLREFWDRLKCDIENAKKIKNEENKTDFPCPKCDGYLVIKHSKYGAFFACENRTNKDNPCDYKCAIGDDGEPVETKKVELERSDFCCENCGKKLLIRKTKKGTDILGCENWKEKLCTGFYNAETGEKIVFEKKKWKKK